MDPLSFAAAVGRQVVRELDGWSSSSGKRGESDQYRRSEIEYNNEVKLDKYEIELLEREISRIHAKKSSYKEIKLNCINYNPKNLEKMRNGEGPVWGRFGDLIIHMEGAHDKETRFRSFKFKCPACGKKSVHTNSIEKAKINTSVFEDMESNKVFIDDLLRKHLGDSEKALNAISKIEFADNPGGPRAEHKGYGYVCSSCGDKNWFRLESVCNCKGSIEVEKGYKNVVPVSAKSSANTTKYCMMCGDDHGIMGGIF